MAMCIYKDSGCPATDACNSEEMSNCGWAIEIMKQSQEDCPFMILKGFRGSAAKCEIPFFRRIASADIPCGNSDGCLLEKVPEVREFVTGSLEDAKKIRALSQDKKGVEKIRNAIIRELKIAPMVSEIAQSHKLVKLLFETPHNLK